MDLFNKRRFMQVQMERNNKAIDNLDAAADYLTKCTFTDNCKLDPTLSLEDVITSIILPIFMISDVPLFSVFSMLFKYYRVTKCF